jgi:5-methylcytosine-specific restriction protein A
VRLFIQPCGDGAPLEHFRDTIQRPVEISTLEGLVEQPILDSLHTSFSSGRAALWGVVSGDKDRQKKIYRRMEEGDILLFTRKGGIFALGEVGQTFESKAAAKKLWGTDGSGQTWENMFAIRRLTYHDIDGVSFKRSVGYLDNYVFRGFSEVQPEKAVNFLKTNTVQRFLKGELLGSSPPNFQPGPTPKPIRGISDPPRQGETFENRASIWKAFGGDWAETVTTFTSDEIVNVFSDDDLAIDYIDPETGVIEFSHTSIGVTRRSSATDNLLEDARLKKRPVRYWHHPSKGNWTFRGWAVVQDRMRLVQKGANGVEQMNTVWFLTPIQSLDESSWSSELRSAEPLTLPELIDDEVVDTNQLLAEYASRSLSLAQESAEFSIDGKPRRKYKRRKEARDLVLARAQNRCEFDGCAGMPFDSGRNGNAILEVDHIIELAFGGPDIPSNMIALCPNCHKAKTYGVNAEKTVKLFQKLVASKEAVLNPKA